MNEYGRQRAQVPEGGQSDTQAVHQERAGEIRQDDPAAPARQPERVDELEEVIP